MVRSSLSYTAVGYYSGVRRPMEEPLGTKGRNEANYSGVWHRSVDGWVMVAASVALLAVAGECCGPMFPYVEASTLR